MSKFSWKKFFLILLTLLVLIPLTLLGALWYQLKSLSPIDLDTNNLNISSNNEIAETINIALFGTDSRKSDYNSSARSDSIIIATLDTKEKKIKLTSIMRDTLVNIPGKGYDKLTHAYAYGGPELAISTINSNFDLNITDYITVDFFSLAKIIDFFGGFEITLTNKEANAMNKALNEINKIENLPYGTDYVESSESPITLNGRQTVSYARIRKTVGGDFERTERQRRVLSYCIEQVQNLSLSDSIGLISNVLPFVNTSLTPSEILNLSSQVLKLGRFNVEQLRLPIDGSFTDEKYNSMWVLKPDIERNIHALHNFINNTEHEYNSDEFSSYEH